jgi:hypothetical protein
MRRMRYQKKAAEASRAPRHPTHILLSGQAKARNARKNDEEPSNDRRTGAGKR